MPVLLLNDNYHYHYHYPLLALIILLLWIARLVRFAVAVAIADGVVADDVARRQQPNKLVLPNDVIAALFLLLLRQMLWLSALSAPSETLRCAVCLGLDSLFDRVPMPCRGKSS